MNDNKVAKDYVNPYLAGGILGVVLFLAFFITGNGLGASGALTRVQVFFTDLVASSHVNNVGYFAHYAGGSKNALSDSHILMLVGTILGGTISAYFGGRLKLETNKGYGISDKVRWISAFIGGMIMLYGARFARGCTSGQGLSGGTALAVGSWIFMFSLFAAGYVSAFIFRKLWRRG